MRHQQLQLTDSFTVIEEGEIARRLRSPRPPSPTSRPRSGG